MRKTKYFDLGAFSFWGTSFVQVKQFCATQGFGLTEGENFNVGHFFEDTCSVESPTEGEEKSVSAMGGDT